MLSAVRICSLGAGALVSAIERPAPPRLALRKLEAAAALGLSYEAFSQYVAPTLRTVRVGSLRLYPVAEMERWLDENAHAPLES